MFMAVAEANKDAHAALMTRSKSKKVRVGIHNKMDVDLLIYDQTHDHGNGVRTATPIASADRSQCPTSN